MAGHRNLLQAIKLRLFCVFPSFLGLCLRAFPFSRPRRLNAGPAWAHESSYRPPSAPLPRESRGSTGMEGIRFAGRRRGLFPFHPMGNPRSVQVSGGNPQGIGAETSTRRGKNSLFGCKMGNFPGKHPGIHSVAGSFGPTQGLSPFQRSIGGGNPHNGMAPKAGEKSLPAPHHQGTSGFPCP